MKISTTSPVEKRPLDISSVMLGAVPPSVSLTGTTARFDGARSEAVEVPARASASSMASNLAAVEIVETCRPSDGMSVRRMNERSPAELRSMTMSAP
jgi:hypothetical protein